MKRLATAAAFASLLLLGQGAATAGILDLKVQLQAGGAGGVGAGGAQQDNAFHAGAQGASYGFIVGAEFLLIDGWVEHNQYVGADGLHGTWTQFMTGIDFNVDLGGKNRGATLDTNGKSKGDGYASTFAELGLAVGFGVGTGQQVMLPLDNSQVTDKGFLVQGHLAVGYRLSKTMSFGVMVPLQAAYMFKSGPGVVANDEGVQYQSIQAAALLNLRFDVSVK